MENTLSNVEYWAIVVLVSALFVYIVSQTIHLVKEGRIYNINFFGRYSRTVSGVEGYIADENGNIVPGENHQKIFFTLPFVEKKATELFSWVAARDTNKIDLNSVDKDNILWGDPKKESKVTFQRSELTDHLRRQEDYQFVLNELETGKVKILSNSASDPADKTAKEKVSDVAENVKVASRLNATVIIRNAYDAWYRNGGDIQWYTSLDATVEGTLGEVYSNTVYADLGDLRGEKLQSILVNNTEPQEKSKLKLNTQDNPEFEFYFADDKGNRLGCITFLQRINYEMLIVKKLGVEVTTITLMNYVPTDEYRAFLEAMQKQAISEVNMQTAKNNAAATKADLDVKGEFIKGVITTYEAAVIKIKETEDVTIVKRAQAQGQLRTLIESGETANEASTFEPININQMVTSSLGYEMALDSKDDSKKKKD